MEIQCLIFDVDGTLVPNVNALIELFQDLVKKYLKKNLSRDEVLSLWGPPDNEIFKTIFPDDIRKQAWPEFLERYENGHPIEGYFSKDQFQLLKDKFRYLAVFTGKGKITCEITLNKIGLTEVFDIILTGNDVKRSKPYPDALFQILEFLNLKKNQTLFLGDSHLDIIAGKAAGILTAGALWGSAEVEKLINSKPDYLFQTPPQFMNFILHV